MKKGQEGFTLIEILISLAILVIGLAGILVLFPVGLNSTKNALEDTNANLITESVLSALQASVERLNSQPASNQLEFFYDGIDAGATFQLPASISGGLLEGTSGQVRFIPGGATQQFATIGLGYDTATAPAAALPYNVTISNDDPGFLQQYSFNIEVSFPSGANAVPGLYDIIIRVRRNARLISRYETQLFMSPPPQ